MNRLDRALAAALEVLSEAGLDCALVGGLAVSARAEPRFTRDVDLAVAIPSDEAAERLLHLLFARGYVLESQVEQEATGRLAAVRLLPPGEARGGVVLDLLFASSGLEPEIVADAEPIEVFPGVHVRVARTRYLIAGKLLSHDDTTRPQDAADLRVLLATASRDELDAVAALLVRIEERGFARGRDLRAAWSALRAARPA